MHGLIAKALELAKSCSLAAAPATPALSKCSSAEALQHASPSKLPQAPAGAVHLQKAGVKRKIAEGEKPCSAEKGTKMHAVACGKKGAEKRAEWIQVQKEAGAKKKYRKPLDLKKADECVEYVAKQKPTTFKNCIVEGDWWKEAAENLEVDVDHLKKAWKNKVQVEAANKEVQVEVVDKTFRNRYAHKRHEARTLKRKRKSGGGPKVKLPELLQDLKIQVKIEEDTSLDLMILDSCGRR